MQKDNHFLPNHLAGAAVVVCCPWSLSVQHVVLSTLASLKSALLLPHLPAC
jgi:hypothetical protein